jgi:hypothetical protein
MAVWAPKSLSASRSQFSKVKSETSECEAEAPDKHNQTIWVLGVHERKDKFSQGIIGSVLPVFGTKHLEVGQ